MKEKNSLFFEELVVFERETLKWIIVMIVFLLVSTLILTFISEEIFQWGIISWPHYWSLFFLVSLFTPYFIFSFIKNFKVWLVKYLIIIFLVLAVGGWIYFTDPKYTMPLFFWFIITANLIGLLFYDTKTLFVANFFTAISIRLLFLHYSKMNILFSAYEVILICIIFILTMMFSFFFIKRTNIFLVELLQKRRELEDEKASLSIKIKARTEQLEELTKSLDQKISERTHELEESKSVLQDRVNELERLHNLTIGRELKMLGLKKEIQKLNDQLSKKG